MAFGNFEKYEDSWDVETSMVLLLGTVNVVQIFYRGGVLVLSFGLVWFLFAFVFPSFFFFFLLNKLFVSQPMGFTSLFLSLLGSGERASSHVGISCHLD